MTDRDEVERLVVGIDRGAGSETHVCIGRYKADRTYEVLAMLTGHDAEAVASLASENEAVRQRAEAAEFDAAELSALMLEDDTERLTQIAAAWEAGHAVGSGKGGCGLPCGYDCNGACFTPPADASAALQARLDAEIRRWQHNSRETWEAMKAMRNSINEHITMPSIEGDLLQGPENSIFCATVAEAVVSEICKSRAEAGNSWNAAIDAMTRYHESKRDALKAEADIHRGRDDDAACEALAEAISHGDAIQHLRRLTPPADASTALTARLDAEWNAAIEAAAGYARRYVHRKDNSAENAIRTLIRPTP